MQPSDSSEQGVPGSKEISSKEKTYPKNRLSKKKPKSEEVNSGKEIQIHQSQLKKANQILRAQEPMFPKQRKLIGSLDQHGGLNLGGKTTQMVPEGTKQSFGGKQSNNMLALFSKQLEGKCYTRRDLQQIADQINNHSSQISDEEQKNETMIVKQILQSKGENEAYNQILLRLKGYQLTGRELNRIKSRILYNLQNQYQGKISYIRSNSTAQLSWLSPASIQKLVRFDFIESQAKKVINRFYFKFHEIRERSENMSKLFQFFKDNKNELKEHFDLKDGLKAGKLSREAYNHDQISIYILLYFIKRSIQTLQAQNVPISHIEQQVDLLISYLSQLYPPGKDETKDDKRLRRVIEDDIEVQWNKQKYPLKQNPKIKFSNDSELSKRQQLERQIVQRARIAKEELLNLQQIIRETCLEKCIGHKTSLKLDPESPSEKALARITEKLLLKEQKQSLEKQYEKDLCKLIEDQHQRKSQTLKGHLQQQRSNYKDKVNNMLKNKSDVEFSISDMVRGKCTFGKIQDIIETVGSINKFLGNHASYRILEIESRFTNPIPISDITLKFALNERVIAELQLTIQKDEVAYSFAHKIYELQRAKAFSKITTIFNYYEDYQKEFNELLANQIKLQKSRKAKEDSGIHEVLVTYFQLADDHKQISKLNELCEQPSLLNQEQKVLTQAVFERLMQKYDDERKCLFYNYYGKSDLFNSVLLYQIIEDINITEGLSICQETHWFQQYLKEKRIDKELGSYLSTIRIKKLSQLNIMVHLYHHQGQGLAQALNFYEETLKVFYGRGLELLNWTINKGIMFEYIEKFHKALQQYKTAQTFSMHMQKSQYEENQELITDISNHKARVLLLLGQLNDAKKVLSDIIKQYKEQKQYKKVMTCRMLQSECYLKQNNYQEFLQQQKQVESVKEIHRVNEDGIEAIRCKYRISILLLDNLQDLPVQQREERIIKGFNYLRSVFGEAKHLKKQQLQKAIEKHCELNKKYRKEQPQPTPRIKIKTLKFGQFGSRKENKLGIKRYQYLKKAQWPQLECLEITNSTNDCKSNKLSNYICLFVSELQKLQVLTLMNTGIQDCSYFIRLTELRILKLGHNQINDRGCQDLSQGKWPKLEVLSLQDNDIRDEGCQFLIKAEWPLLQQIRLDGNEISTKGCKYLSKAKWLNLKRLQLSYCKVVKEQQKCREILERTFPKEIIGFRGT